MNRENLTKLAEYLESLPKDYEHFDMGYFFAFDQRYAPSLETRYAEDPSTLTHTCGTVACALGHGPAAGIPVPEACLNPDLGINFGGYAALFVEDCLVDEYDWLFAGAWASVDNTLRGASARIRYLLDGNDVPEDCLENLTEADSEAQYYPALYAKYLV